jgi:hypothetical protein
VTYDDMLGTHNSIPTSFPLNSGEKEIIDNDERVIFKEDYPINVSELGISSSLIMRCKSIRVQRLSD